MNRQRLYSLYLLLFGTFSCLAVEQVKHIGIDQSLDQQKHYFPSVLQLAIDKSTDKYGPARLFQVDLPMEAQRQFISLDNKLLDVIWTMTSNEREQEALPVRIPLLKGLLGYRVLVIRQKQQAQFAAIKQLNELKKLTAVQGYGWPDVQILQENGFNVESSAWYDSIYKSLDAGFYDYFPRSVLEAWSELSHYQYDNLKVDEQHLLVYPTAIYFFVAKHRPLLAERLAYGLHQAIADGSFDELFNQFPQHVDAVAKLNSQTRQVYTIPNPILPQATPLHKKHLWFQFK